MARGRKFWHRSIRGMFRILFKRVGPVAQMVHSSHDVQEEFPGLVQGDREKRPADVFFSLMHTSLIVNQNLTTHVFSVTSQQKGI